MAAKKPTRITILLPQELKAKIEAEAKRNARSASAEAFFRLQSTFDRKKPA